MAEEAAPNRQVYAFVQELIELAHAAGDIEAESMLRDALCSGFTASEQLGGVRDALRVMLNETSSRPYLAPAVVQIKRTIREIDTAFRRANRPF